MRHTASRVRIVVVALSVVGLGLTTLSPAQADPKDADQSKVTVKDVEAAFDKVEASSEAVNRIGEDITATKSQIAELSAQIHHDEKAYDRQREELSAAIVQQQLDAPLGPTVNLLGSADPTKFLDGLGAIQALNSTRADALENFGKVSKELKNRKAQLEDRESDLAKSKSEAKKKETQIRERYDKAKAQLARLNAAQQAAFNQSDTDVDFEVDASGRAKKAIDFALAQLGEPYSWGGTGPNAWDCSGLMLGAYGAAGVGLGRTTYSQVANGRSVSMGSLKPGDLVFYGNLQHVGMYLGNGKVVHAPRPGKSVEVEGLSGYSKAKRIVG